MILETPTHKISFPRRPLLMGIVNINDDSFSGDGTLDPKEALEQARKKIQEGADIIDIGAESARTNREPISVEEEVFRLRSFLDHWVQLRDETKGADDEQISPALLSVNTWRPEVVEQIIGHEIDLLNDMSALPDDRNARLCAQHGVPLLIMHSVGQPKVSHTHKGWSDLMGSMIQFFEEKIETAKLAGLKSTQIVIDPGLDFAKQKDDNLLVLRELKKIENLGCPVLLPISRKTIIGDVLNLPDPCERDPGTVALLTQGVLKGAHIFRVHNVRACWETLKVISPFPPKLRIILNLAISADGKISTTRNSPAHFTSKADLERLLEIRKQADAILVGRTTLEADQMTMTTEGSKPWRCVISKEGNFDENHPFFHTDGGPRHLVISSDAKTPELPATIHRTDLSGFLKKLRNNPDITTLLCEGGGSLARQLFELDLIDEINLTWAPHTLFGGEDAPTITGLPGDFLPSSRHYELAKMTIQQNNEVFLTYYKSQLES
ncbi:MAG: dihydropteroate synthase [Akkermansiaceae bacterium]|nr:dihydropteroate synthase [Akkermansiaceae bacterium]